MNPSPLRYPGGKYKLHGYIAELVEKNNCSTYIEPFCGGAAIAFGLLFSNTVKKIIINDYDYTIYCFWDCVLNNCEELKKKIKDSPITIEEWKKQKAIRENIYDNEKIDIAFSTFFLNRVNRSGIIDKAGPIGGFGQTGNYLIDCRFNKDKLIKQIDEINSYRNHIKLYNLEALDFIDEVILNTRRSFVFFDPPYYRRGPELYSNSYCHGDHSNLAKEITTKMKSRKWIVTYDDSTEIKAMYPNTDGIVFKLQYTLQKKRLGSEVMFFSKQVRRLANESEYLMIEKRKEND